MTKTFDTKCLDLGGYPIRNSGTSTSSFPYTLSASGTDIKTSNPHLDFIFREGITPSIDSHWNNKADNKYNQAEIENKKDVKNK